MRNLLGMTVLLALAGWVAEAGEPKKARQFRIELKLLQGDPLGCHEEGGTRCLAQPILCILEGSSGTFLSGGQQFMDGEYVDVGFKARIKPRQVEGGIELSV